MCTFQRLEEVRTKRKTTKEIARMSKQIGRREYGGVN